MFNFFYLTLCSLAYIVSTPFLLLLSFKSKYRHSIPARFFLIKNPRFKDIGVHIHACSLGEVVSLKNIIDLLPNKQINITVITQSGYSKAISYTKTYQNVEVRYLPFEIFLPFWLKNNSSTVVTEAELWYQIFRVAKSKNSKTALINARINSRSYSKYYKLKRFYNQIFKNIDSVVSQSDSDGQRLASIGAKNITTLGNIKLLNEVIVTKKLTKPDGQTIVAASTHSGEEQLIANAFKKYGKGKLVVVPRHPERFGEVGSILSEFCKQNSYSYSKYSETNNFSGDVVLVDTLGELINIYAISDIVILGGAFAKIGGHNPLEPAKFKNKIITGVNIFNQRELFRYVSDVQYCLDDCQDIANALCNCDNMKESVVTEKVDRTLFEEKIREVCV